MKPKVFKSYCSVCMKQKGTEWEWHVELNNDVHSATVMKCKDCGRTIKLTSNSWRRRDEL